MVLRLFTAGANPLALASMVTDIRTTLDKYKSLGEYFSPDFEQENEVLKYLKTVTT